MKKFLATKYEVNKFIELADSTKLEELYNTIEQPENFILEWTDGTTKMNKIIIASDLIGKVKAGDVELLSKEKSKWLYK